MALAQPWRGGLLASVVAMLLAGCSQDMSDLREFVERTKQRPGGEIEPLPEFEPYRSFAYDSASLRNPFRPQEGFADPEPSDSGPEDDNGLAPDPERRKEPLEQFPLDSLRMVGTLSREGRQHGLVRDPDGTIHQVLPDNYLGQNHGRVVSVDESKIRVVEIVPDGQGGWMERDAALALSVQE